MSTKRADRCAACCALALVALLVGAIALLWALFANGTLSTTPRTTPTHSAQNAKNFTTTTTPGFGIRNTTDLIEEDATKEKIETQHEKSGDDSVLVRVVKTSPPPLHHYDRVYDQQTPPGHGTPPLDRPGIRHGHFRHPTSQIWDPHPEYLINLQGHPLRLALRHDAQFVAPDVHVAHIWKDATRKNPPQHAQHECFYTGVVKGDQGSSVAVSLCGGMTGYIHTNDGSYYISPEKEYIGKGSEETQGGMHRITKIRHHGDGHGGCDTPDHNSDTLDRRRRDLAELRKTRVPRLRQPHEQYYIETLVVADKKMYEYHGNERDLLQYVLTLMSHVALLYRDKTIGNPINVVVVKVLVLRDVEFVEPGEGGVASHELHRRFCQFQQEHNQGIRYDAALLLTRENICSNLTSSRSCDTLGLAQLGAMCSEKGNSCAIVRDKGMPTSYTIAHELGHLLDMPHDNDLRCKSHETSANQNTTHIMIRMMQANTKPWLWSPCSRHYLTEFINTDHAQCLLNKPNTDLITGELKRRLPGENVAEDKQCELTFGNGSRVCSYMAACGALWCDVAGDGESEYCRTVYLPWAEGSSCGPGYWCRRGECVREQHTQLVPVDGGWGPWGEWGPCSRTCGGGIRRSERRCDSPAPQDGGSYCIGSHVRHRSCFLRPCQDADADFRAEQCAQFNGRTFNLSGLEPEHAIWVPKHGLTHPADLCRLHCRVRDRYDYFRLAERVVDGTPCAPDTFDVCVDGVCREAGCDRKLSSRKKLDSCGVCGGDNSHCRKISGVKDIREHRYGYTRALVIPKGSSGLDIRHELLKDPTDTDANYLALVDPETKEYKLNGNFNVLRSYRTLTYGGVMIEYNGSPESTEKLSSPKGQRLLKDLAVEVLSVGQLLPSRITYSYMIVENESAINENNEFISKKPTRHSWMLRSNGGSCSRSCQGHVQLVPTCVHLDSGREAQNSSCSTIPAPNSQFVSCNTHCHYDWESIPIGDCVGECGQTGERSVRHICTRITNGEKEPMNDHECSNIPKPTQTKESCYVPSCWQYTPWSECSATCGDTGIQIREAKCLGQEECKGNPAELRRACNRNPCPEWRFGSWTPCSVTCGRGYRTRPAECVLGSDVINAELCGELKDVPRETCEEIPCFQWHTSDWQSCTVTCGTAGIQRREVTCRTIEGKVVEDQNCAETRPEIIRRCDSKIPCPTHQESDEDNEILPTLGSNTYASWRSGPWSVCSKTCGGGTQKRMVACQDPRGRCDPAMRPVDTITCGNEPCPRNSDNDSSQIQTTERPRLKTTPEITKTTYITKPSTSFYPKKVTPDYKRDPYNIFPETPIYTKPYENPYSKPDTSPKVLPTKPSNTYEYLPEGSKYSSGSHSAIPTKPSTYDYLPEGTKYTPGELETPDPTKERPRFAPRWRVGAWSSCSTKNVCGTVGRKSRYVQCSDSISGATLVDQYCIGIGQKKPPSLKRCKSRCGRHAANLLGRWEALEWGDCESVACGEPGIQRRTIRCIGGTHCDIKEKPSEEKSCVKSCGDERFNWLTGAWGECSHDCGRRGRQTRTVHCVDRNGSEVPSNYCIGNRPPRRKKCNQHRCGARSCREIKRRLGVDALLDREYDLFVKGKRLRVYCDGMRRSHAHPLEFLTLPSERNNYAEMYGGRLDSAYSTTCPAGGKRLDPCPSHSCLPGKWQKSGLTLFSKIRIDVKHLRLIPNDWTHSRQLTGKPVEFGTAGDCYSSARTGCPQGRFSIDLGSNRVRLIPNVRWSAHGRHANANVHISEDGKRVSGKCGGRCGTCRADTGLIVEIV